MKTRPLWLYAAVLCVPFALGNKGCEGTSHEVSDLARDASIGSGSATGDDARNGDAAIGTACDKCLGPQPGAPNYLCDDGSTAGPVCARDAKGQCGWQFRSCPDAKDAGPAASAFSCGTRGGASCEQGEFCKLKGCGRLDEGGTCTQLPQACTLEFSPVCGCDGKTYPNVCGAESRGVSVDYPGECKNAEPQPCNSCGAPSPGAPNYPCKDGVHIGGPACVISTRTGKCGWQILSCPEETAPGCGNANPPLDPGQCWSDADCPKGKLCQGEQVCPCNSACLLADMPGTCKG